MKLKGFLQTFPRFSDGESAAYADLMTDLGNYIPNEPYAQYTAARLFDEVVPRIGTTRLLDLGCGRGRSQEVIREHNPSVTWYGVDVEETYQISDKTKVPREISFYNGVDIPFPDIHFGYIYSNQVFEHVRQPERLLKEVHRVLTPGGRFFGSLSGLEPYHWRSLFNYTPLGWHTLLTENHFRPIKYVSGVDGISLILHHWSPKRSELGALFSNSVLNRILLDEEDQSPSAVKWRNLIRLVFAGHLMFIATKD